MLLRRHAIYHQHLFVQVDEPALREGLPLKQDRWGSYLEWAVDSFRLSTAVAAPHTQIVTHLCYSDFQDILKVINFSCAVFDSSLSSGDSCQATGN